MRLKTLLFLILISGGMLHAEDTIRSLVITEACLRSQSTAYIEITNMGDKDIQLSNFKLGNLKPWGPAPYETDGPDYYFMLPEKILSPGASFVVASVMDFEAEQFAKGLDGYNERLTKEEMWGLADVQFHIREKNHDETDSVTTVGPNTLSEIWYGRNCLFLEQHFENGDSVVIDQVNGVFDGPGSYNGYVGLNQAFPDDVVGGYDVAGYSRASDLCYLVRKFAIKNGNLDFADARGVGDNDSEWIPIPMQGGPWRKALWTIGNHVNAVLDETTLESDVIEVDFANKTLTVPWGVRRNDDIMNYFVKKPGIGWNYHYSPNKEDSLSYAAKTGDKLELFVCGNGVSNVTFNIIVKEPANDTKLAVPVANEDPKGNWRDLLDDGMLAWPRITQHSSGIDTIWGERGGIPYATSIDSLVDRLEISANAKWEVVFMDGMKRPHLKEGDKFKIIAKDGSFKEYYISVNDFRPSHNAQLSAITWPDIPEYYKGVFGWKGDTIPNFGESVYNYKLAIPVDVSTIPALIAKTQDINAIVKVERASSLSGTTENRTIKFLVTAEDGITTQTYSIELIKEKDFQNVQPFKAEPFISEIVFKEQWANSWLEICNPGNQPLDLSNYMFVNEWTEDPASAIEWNSAPENYSTRYIKYIPGYKYTNNETNWQSSPAILEQDLNVSPIVLPGDVFVMGDIRGWWLKGYPWFASEAADIDFGPHNPWSENIPDQRSAIGQWGGSVFVFKMTNDSIKRGLKAPNDINDFELIDIYRLTGNAMVSTHIRKPDIWKGNTLIGDSQDNGDGESEWIFKEPGFWEAQGFDGNTSHANVASDVGQHNFVLPTHYMSTISSLVYKVSEGYSLKETIKGMKTGTSVADFLANIIKANDSQSLKVTSVINGAELAMDAILSLNDTLTVMSADRVNTSKYVLNVTAEGLSSNAVLTSAKYDITIEQEPKSAGNENAGIGNLQGFDYGTSLKTILANTTVPSGATLTVINGEGAYVPLKTLNFDTTYVNVTVNDNIYLNVVAEDGVTEIVYQLIPASSDNDAFILSDIYNVVQKDVLIQYVPRGTTVSTLLSNIVASAGASMKVANKMGQERLDGIVADDDKVVVTSLNGEVSKAYYISMLAEKYVRETTYLAYILSNTYAIDQIVFRVDGVDGSENVANFLAKVIPAAGATAIVIDKDGLEKTSGNINNGNKVKVTSADGKIVVLYSFGTLTSTNTLSQNEISVYPNPTNDKINVAGVEPGDRIQVINSVGTTVSDLKVVHNIESFSLKNKSAGIYMVVISKNNSITGRYKVIKF